MLRIEVMLGWDWSDVVECRGVHLDFLPASYPRLRVSPPFPYMTQPQTRNLETGHLSIKLTAAVGGCIYMTPNNGTENHPVNCLYMCAYVLCGSWENR